MLVLYPCPIEVFVEGGKPENWRKTLGGRKEPTSNLKLAAVGRVLENTQNLVISRCFCAEFKRTCTAIALLIKPLFAGVLYCCHLT